MKFWVTIALLIAIPATLVCYKIFWLHYEVADVLPQKEYTITTRMSFDGHTDATSARTFVPVTDERQIIGLQEQQAPVALRFSTEDEGQNRVALWSGTAVPNQTSILHTFTAQTIGLKYVVDPHLKVPASYESALRVHLQPSEYIQVDAPEIVALAAKIGANKGTALERLTKIYDFTMGLETRAFKGTTDALTAARLGEASCNGKSRLFVGLARAVGLPSRLVGGLILAEGKKRTSHQWVEVNLGGHWVPFCPTNGHFAELPANYLVFYRGDEALFKHTSDINFDYEFSTVSKLVPSERARETLSAFNVWDLFARLKLPFSLLRTVLMLPIGALVVVLFRNVIGVPTFGTFLPALIAAAAGATGVLWGLVSLLIVLLAVVIARRATERLGLLHSPTLAILLVVVVLTMIGTSFAAERLGLLDLAKISYFPIAVMAIASERFYLALVEKGKNEAAKQLTGTLIVVLGCYIVMNSLAVQMIVSGFPEVLLLAVAANIYIGRWVGVRMLEMWRFRNLMGSST
jgi:transglutaminase-like putative cysteine protease